jgi:hypothetical protein
MADGGEFSAIGSAGFDGGRASCSANRFDRGALDAERLSFHARDGAIRVGAIHVVGSASGLEGTRQGAYEEARAAGHESAHESARWRLERAAVPVVMGAAHADGGCRGKFRSRPDRRRCCIRCRRAGLRGA